MRLVSAVSCARRPAPATPSSANASRRTTSWSTNASAAVRASPRVPNIPFTLSPKKGSAYEPLAVTVDRWERRSIHIWRDRALGGFARGHRNPALVFDGLGVQTRGSLPRVLGRAGRCATLADELHPRSQGRPESAHALAARPVGPAQHRRAAHRQPSG